MIAIWLAYETKLIRFKMATDFPVIDLIQQSVNMVHLCSLLLDQIMFFIYYDHHHETYILQSQRLYHIDGDFSQNASTLLYLELIYHQEADTSKVKLHLA